MTKAYVEISPHELVLFSYLRAFVSTLCLFVARANTYRSSSDDSVVEAGGEGVLPLPATLALDKSFVAGAEDFRRAWESLQICASFRQEKVRPERPRLTLHP